MNAIQRLCLDKGGVGIVNKVNEELSSFIEILKLNSEPADIGNSINLSVANVMCSVLYGNRHGYTDEKLLWYLDIINKDFEKFMREQLLLDCFPFLIWAPFFLTDRNEKKINKLKEYFGSYYAEINDTYAEGNETCLVHHLMTVLKADCSSTWKDVLDKSSETWLMLHEFMAAGSETTSTAIKWLLLYLIREPSIQEKARDEIDKVIGINGIPTVSHRKQLPFLEAVIMEGLRIGHIVPLTLPHSVEEDNRFRGFLIPKNTTILLNLASLLKDPNIYPEPESFKPERFLSEGGSSVVVPEEFIPFGKGPRSCPGESVARNELFLYMTTLLQKFYFHRPENEPLPDTDGTIAISYSPKPYRIRIVPRQA